MRSPGRTATCCSVSVAVTQRSPVCLMTGVDDSVTGRSRQCDVAERVKMFSARGPTSQRSIDRSDSVSRCLARRERVSPSARNARREWPLAPRCRAARRYSSIRRAGGSGRIVIGSDVVIMDCSSVTNLAIAASSGRRENSGARRPTSRRSIDRIDSMSRCIARCERVGPARSIPGDKAGVAAGYRDAALCVGIPRYVVQAGVAVWQAGVT
jgi:hypothetical protein